MGPPEDEVLDGLNITYKSFLKTQQRSSVFGTCFDVSNIIVSHNEYIIRVN